MQSQLLSKLCYNRVCWAEGSIYNRKDALYYSRHELYLVKSLSDTTLRRFDDWNFWYRFGDHSDTGVPALVMVHWVHDNCLFTDILDILDILDCKEDCLDFRDLCGDLESLRDEGRWNFEVASSALRMLISVSDIVLVMWRLFSFLEQFYFYAFVYINTRLDIPSYGAEIWKIWHNDIWITPPW